MKECEICGQQALAPCAACGKHVCVQHGAKKVEDDGSVVFYCNDDK